MNMTLRGVLYACGAILIVAFSGFSMADGGKAQKAKEEAFRAKLRGGVSSEVTKVAPVFPGAKLQLDDSARNLSWIFEVPATADAKLKQHYLTNKPSLVHGSVQLATGTYSTIVTYKVYSPDVIAKRQLVMDEMKANPPTEEFMGVPLLEGMQFDEDCTFKQMVSPYRSNIKWLRCFQYAGKNDAFRKALFERSGVSSGYSRTFNPVDIDIYVGETQNTSRVEISATNENASKVKPFNVAKTEFDAKGTATNPPKAAAAPRPAPVQNQNSDNPNNTNHDPTQQVQNQPQQQAPQAPAVTPANIVNGVNLLKGLFGR